MALLPLKRLTQELRKPRQITTSLSGEVVIECSRTAATGLPPKRTVLDGTLGHCAYTHPRTGRPTVGFGAIGKEGQLGPPKRARSWTVEFADGRHFVLTEAMRDGRSIREEKELVRYLDAFAAELRKHDPNAMIEVME